MIPITLQIQNFMSYRESVPELDFTGMTVVALCGRNGHGKSALLDAITWCLWGKSRVRSADDIVSLGAEETRVELTFSASNAVYRVIRSHIKSGGRRKTGVTDLQLQITQSESSIPLTEDSIRATQAKIIDVLKMDYDTFVNSAFLLQGKSDEFTSKTPSERKEILANILGLGIYDKLQDLSKQRLAVIANELQNIHGTVGYIQSGLEASSIDVDEFNKQIALRAKDLQELKLEHELINKGFNAQTAIIATLEIEIKNLQQLNESKASIEKELEFLQKNRSDSQSLLSEYKDLISNKTDIEENHDSYIKAKQELTLQEQSQALSINIQAELSKTVLEISRQETALQTSLTYIKNEIKALTQLSDTNEELSKAHATILEQIEENQLLVKEIENQKQHESQLTSQLSEKRTLTDLFVKEGEAIKQKLAVIEASGNNSHSCPLCQSDLTEHTAENLKTEYLKEIEAKRMQYFKNKADIDIVTAKLEGQIISLKKQTSIFEQTRSRLDSKLNSIKASIEQSSNAIEQITFKEKEASQVTHTISNNLFAEPEQQKKQQLENQLVNSTYDEAKIISLRNYISAHDNLTVQFSKLQTAIIESTKTESNIRELDALVQQKITALSDLDANLGELKNKMIVLESHRTEYATLKTSIDLNNLSIRDCESEIKKYEDLIDKTKKANEELKKYKSQQLELEKKHSVFTEVVNAFGKQGIQAMLIESLIPQIEEETNLLLSKMTDNRLYTTLETTRERRTGKGDPIETLEISIADELGKRSYESYSGGESFRINLALRIALSKVLARRSGASLPVLFLDEGFGTQDSIGREKILDTIGSISDQFEKIIVITHLDDLKDSFPTRIEVEKTEAGSTFSISSS